MRRQLPLLIAGFALLGILVIRPGPAGAASSAVSLYNQANQLYKQERWEDAAKAYQAAIDAGLHHPWAYFNLANAELRAGRLGLAILNYRRAERLAPRDPDIKFNLDYARKRIKARPEPGEKGPFARAFNRVAGFLSAGEWILLLLAVYWSAGLSLAVFILARKDMPRKAASAILVCAVSLLVLAAPFAGVKIKRDLFTSRGVITAEKVTARSGPDEGNAALFELYEGVEVVVGECELGYCRVNAEGFIGWIPAKSFERL